MTDPTRSPILDLIDRVERWQEAKLAVDRAAQPPFTREQMMAVVAAEQALFADTATLRQTLRETARHLRKMGRCIHIAAEPSVAEGVETDLRKAANLLDGWEEQQHPPADRDAEVKKAWRRNGY